MKTTKSALLFAILAVAAAGTAACSDTGDNSSSPDSGGDATMTGDDGPVGTDTGNVVDTGNGVDSNTPGDDSTAPEASADTGSPADTGSTDSSEMDSTVETGAPDTGTEDAPVDTGTDVTSPDTGTPDTGTPDTGTPDTGTPDTGMPDTGTPDTGNDSSTTAVFDAHCATNNGGAGCTATELLLIEKDTNADGSGKTGKTAYGCYDCMVAQGCLDDSLMASDVDHECGDTGGNGITQPTLSGHPATASCLAVVSCILGGNCAGDLGSGTCYCGTAVGANCNVAGNPNGACLMQEEDGTDSNSPPTVNNRFTNTAYAAGMANTIFSCAASNTCTQCYP
jgi:hypothetical protein